DRLRAEHDGLHSRCTDFVDECARDFESQSCTMRDLGCGRLAQPCGEYVANENFLDVSGFEVDFLEGCFYGCGAELSGGDRRKTAPKTANWCPHCGYDIHFFHTILFCCTLCTCELFRARMSWLGR